MARLNTEKAIKKGYAIMNTRYALSIHNVRELEEKKPVDAICDAFAMGYYQGMKAEKSKASYGG